MPIQKKTKIIAQKRPTPSSPDAFTGKVYLEKLRAIWNDDDVTYSDEELIRIREWLYAISEVIVSVVNGQNTSKIITP